MTEEIWRVGILKLTRDDKFMQGVNFSGNIIWYRYKSYASIVSSQIYNGSEQGGQEHNYEQDKRCVHTFYVILSYIGTFN